MLSTALVSLACCSLCRSAPQARLVGLCGMIVLAFQQLQLFCVFKCCHNVVERKCMSLVHYGSLCCCVACYRPPTTIASLCYAASVAHNACVQHMHPLWGADSERLPESNQALAVIL